MNLANLLARTARAAPGLPAVFLGTRHVHDYGTLARRADELHIRVGSYKRNLILPQSLKRMVVREANFAGDHLEIVFGRGSQPADPERG